MRKTTIKAFLAICIASVLASPPRAHAALTIYQATGYSPADIAGVVEQFRRDISEGGENNGDQPRPFVSGWREITWDGLPDREIQYTDLINYGATFLPPAVGVIGVSATPTGPSDPNRYFGDINPTYSTTFQPFSPPSLAGYTLGVPGISALMNYTIPGTTLGGGVTVRGLGIVFSDVDLPNTTSIFINPTTEVGMTFFVPPSPGDGGLSFLGLLMDPGIGIMNAAIVLGNRPLSATAVDGAPHDLRPGAIIDVVAMDNVIFSEPTLIIPEPSPVVMTLMGAAVLLIIRSSTSKRSRDSERVVVQRLT